MHPSKSARLGSLIFPGLILVCLSAVSTVGATPRLAAAHSGAPGSRTARRFEIAMRPCDRQRTSVPGDVSAQVMDLQGRSLKLLPCRAMAISHGELVFNWDGTTEQGGTVAPGVYRLRVAAPSLSLRTERLVLVR